MVVIRQSPRAAAARSAAARHAPHAASHMHMADPVPVSVDGRDIPEEEIRAEMHNHPGPDPDTARNAAAQALVIRELLLNAARARDITARPDTDGQGRQERQVAHPRHPVRRGDVPEDRTPDREEDGEL